MSHFAVAVRVESRYAPDDFQDRLAHHLLPFKEAGCGDNDPPGLKRYLKFHDTEDEMRAEWEKDSCSMVKLADGEILSRFDDRLKNPNYNPFGQDFGEKYIVPANATEFEMPFKERFPNFITYAEDYCGYKKDEEKNRYGYWQNPNRRWDWWQVGGRFSNRLPDRFGNHDFLRIDQIAHECVRADGEQTPRQIHHGIRTTRGRANVRCLRRSARPGGGFGFDRMQERRRT